MEKFDCDVLNLLQGKVSRYALFGAIGSTVLLFLGTFVWLQFPSQTIEAELRALRPTFTKKVPPFRLNVHGAVAAKNERGAVWDDGKVRILNAPKRTSSPLQPHPDLNMIERMDIGLLPIIGADGRQSWQVYSRPFDTLEKRPKVAIVVTGLGVSFSFTELVVGSLPGEVTLAFVPFARNLKQWINFARGTGHEVLINLPMEPRNYPRNDPGPFGLLTEADTKQNIRRLDWVLSRMTGYVGVTNYMGERFMANQRAMRPILSELQRRGLLFLDNNIKKTKSVTTVLAPKLQLPFATIDMILDKVVSRKSIDSALAEIERLAELRGSAVALARPYPVTVRRLQHWISSLDAKGIVLAPITAIIAK